MAAVAATVIIAILTGLTVAAYRHPIAFRPLGFCCQALVLAFTLCVVAYNSGLSAGRFAVTLAPSEDIRSYKNIFQAFDEAQIPSWTLLIAGLVAAYLGFLSFLPQLGLVAEKK